MSNDSRPDYYVGIGASAGGLEALQACVKNISLDSGNAYVIVQHLSPDFKSMMPELLSRHTELPILLMTDEMEIEPNKIYLAPARTNVMLSEGKVLLVEQLDSKGAHYPIDAFFRALAEDQQHRSIAIILSGTGSDGSRGIQAIKEVGGLVMVQEPTNAAFDGMPISAIKTGFYDIICDVQEIIGKLTSYTNHTVVSGEKSVLETDTERAEHALKEIYDLLKIKSDIDFTLYKGKTILRRIERRMGINSLDNITDYYAFLLKNPRELQTLAKDMLIGVTRFFRDSEAFIALEETVIPEILKNHTTDDIIRIWVACCSTGEEAYSIAILIEEALERLGLNKTVRIFATDVDPDAIADASLGHYSHNIASDMSEERINRYFIQHDEYYQILPSIRQKVVFATHNLLSDPPFSNCQLATCRNALIYFQPKAQKRIIAMLHFALNQYGYLFLGSSESLGEMSGNFDVVNDRTKIYQKTTSARLITNTIPSLMSIPESNGASPSVNQLISTFQKSQRPSSYTQVYESIIENYAPPAIILSEDMSVLHVFGEVAHFTQKIRSGKFSANLSDLINDSLSTAVTTAVYRAQSKAHNVQYENIQFVDEHGDIRHTNLRVLYISNSKSAQIYYVLLFELVGEFSSPDAEGSDANYAEQRYSQQLIKDLEDALKKKQEHLQVTVEELQTTNEELQSSNEELMAANEELQSTNEELQSVNEELYSVNSEYQEKIEATIQANLDTENIIRSAKLGFIFLDDALLIRKFTQESSDDIFLLPTDVGRPFHHISHSLIYDNFLTDISKVCNSGEPIETTVATKKGRVKLINISPYTDEHGVTFGCVIAITDITDIQRLESKLEAYLEELKATQNNRALMAKEDTIHVLVVDDDEVDVEMITRMLNKETFDPYKYELTIASSFQMGRELLAKEHFDVCLADYKLDAHTGLDLVAGLSDKNKELAFILLSGYLDDIIREKSIELGVYDILDKADINAQLLQRSISYALRHQKTEKFLLQHNETD
ncbi:chemotaxis protein CheB [Reinekea marina]|uniref:Chemotaxis protein CheB n=1 Tax=Reinekea marina TaxID=1310421 RepID=A0ABV7WS15_9GAMM